MLKNDCASERLRYKIVKVTAGVLVNTYFPSCGKTKDPGNEVVAAFDFL